MRQAIRLFILGEGASFLAAALVHFGVLLRGYEHQATGTAETVIGSVLLIGLASTSVFGQFTRGIGIGVQALALLGTFVGIFTIIVGIGPRTVPDITYHIIIVIALIAGLIVAVRASRPATVA